MVNHQGVSIPPSPALNGILRRKDYAIDDASASVRRASRPRLSSIHPTATENTRFHNDSSIYNETLRNQKRKFDETRKENLDLKLQIFYLQQEMGRIKENRRRSSGTYAPKQNLYYESENDSRGTDHPLKESFDEVISSMTEENNQLKDEIASGLTKLQNTEMQLRETKEAIASLSATVDETKAQNTELRKSRSNLEEKLKIASESQKNLHKQLREAEICNKTQKKRLEGERDAIRNELHEARANHKEQARAHANLQQRVKEHQTHTDTLLVQVHNSCEEASVLEKQLAEKSKQVDGITVQLQALKFDNEALREENRKSNQETEETEARVADLQTQLDSLEELARKQGSDLALLQAELERAIRQRDSEREMRRNLCHKLLPADMPGISPGDYNLTIQPPALCMQVRKQLHYVQRANITDKAKNWRENILEEIENTLKQICATQTRLEMERSKFVSRYCRQARSSKPPFLTNAKLAL